jgi:hypothetical protein
MKTIKFAADGEHYCDNCCKHWDADELKDIEDLHERLEAGGVVPSGECPECGSLCYPLQLSKEKKYYVEVVQPCPHCDGQGGVWEGDERIACPRCDSGKQLSFARSLVTKNEYIKLVGCDPDEETGVLEENSNEGVPF